MRAGLQFLYDCVTSALTIVAIMWGFFSMVGVNDLSIAVALIDGAAAWGLSLWWALDRARVEA